MTLAISRTIRKPLWMAPLRDEGLTDVFFGGKWPAWPREIEEELAPNVDFIEKDGKYFLTAELPGIKRDDISVSVEDGYVTVKGKKESNKEEEGTNYYLKETRSGSFSRSFRLPGKVDEENVDAIFKDGMLTIAMPLEKAAEAKKIEIH